MTGPSGVFGSHFPQALAGRQTSGPQTTGPSDDPVVNEALSVIRKEFSENVDQDDLELITELWRQLTPEQAREVFDHLTPEEISAWGSEAQRSTGWTNNGLTGGQQQALFDDLATKLTGEQLYAVATAFDNHGRMRSAVAEHATSDVQGEFLVASVPDAEDPASAAVALIRKEFSENVDQDDLELVSLIWASLTPEEAQRAFDQLSDEEIAFWGSEAQRSTGWTNNGLTGGQQQALFDDLAGKLTGEQLAQVAEAFGNHPRMTEALLQHGSPTARADYALAISGDVSSAVNYRDANILTVETTTTYGNPEAHAAVSLLVSLADDPEEFNRVLEGLIESGTLDEVLQIARGQVDKTRHGDFESSYDVSPLTTIIDAAAEHSSLEVRAHVFEAGAGTLDLVSGNTPGGAVADGSDEATAAILDSLDALLAEDATGTLAILESRYRDGDGLTSFMREMIAHDRYDDVAGLVVQAQRGNDGDGDPADRFIATDGDGNYRNAQVLGYVVGSMQSGITELNLSSREQAEELQGIFGAIALVGQTTGTLGEVTTSGLEWVTSQKVEDALNDLASQRIDLARAIRDLAYPQDGDGNPVEFERAETAYDAAVGRVIDAQTQE